MNRPRPSDARQRGIALLAMLLVVGLVTVLAVGLAHANLLRLSLTERRLEAAQAWEIWHGGLEWARDILREDVRRNAHDHNGEAWARGMRDYAVEGGRLSGLLVDQQGLFNLNNLVRQGRVSESDLAAYRRLLEGLGLPGRLAEATADWIDADRSALPGGAEDAEYAGETPPRRTANRPIQHLAELYAIRGYDATTVERLRPYVCALPAPTRLNLNTAPREVLAAVLPQLDDDVLQRIVSRRQSDPYTSLQAVRADLPQGVSLDETGLQVASQYFLLRLRVQYGRARADGEALLERGASLPRVLWQAQGLARPLELTNPLQDSELTLGGV